MLIRTSSAGVVVFAVAWRGNGGNPPSSGGGGWGCPMVAAPAVALIVAALGARRFG